MDIDNSGTLELCEVKKMIDDFTRFAKKENRPDEDAIRKCFEILDKDGSGVLEFEEIIPLVKGIIYDIWQNMWLDPNIIKFGLICHNYYLLLYNYAFFMGT